MFPRFIFLLIPYSVPEIHNKNKNNGESIKRPSHTDILFSILIESRDSTDAAEIFSSQKGGRGTERERIVVVVITILLPTHQVESEKS